MLYIVIGNVIVFVLDMFSRYSFSHMLTFVPYYIFHGQIWRLVTFIFVPEGSKLFFVAISLYFYYFIGNALEREWGSARFTVFYGIGVLVNIAVGLVLSFLYGLNYPWPVVSMYYINMSLFFAFAALYPDLQVLLFFIIPVKVKWLAWIDAAFFAWSILSSLFHLNWVGVVLPVVAILNFLLFFSSDAARIFGRVRHRTSRQTINFKKATKEAKKDKGYLHKCAVCGITDADDPNMEFRYCSKCSGYYCYCMDHINNHVHIQ
ncbi:rhomboid family intramembrane serine protease [Intestinimonas massiliensis]|uniref:Rhomboid family intramembrane serine protease n=2 Tax=Eubacteriales incertae sedis TaxID=538999 RepID=A0ABS9M9J6_9FIRM|nr:rhomboid family intramembrane serine protease [Intestinimonas massiliensis (ex Afouda et al. 2020)]MCG4527170.1 rhomboid family intramembrane serine protease [Intestinimonas massiliensis (ex Afouda et al. 2020)]MCI5563657.1 rhomboid family intramembrane serine protease [Intestinimonas massiliensis (ex Afouda et al. 2020)]MCQ4806292.1 rhomboid family intramembrane serine protease [Intestinimonas massiliensis (ex Afouda et al. 2020)]